jgi:NAD(P)H-dependent FMN reductase
MKLLAVAASLRRGSWNRKLLACAVSTVRDRGVEVDLAEFAEFDVPLYNADVQNASGIPGGAVEFGRRIGAADGLVLVSP